MKMSAHLDQQIYYLIVYARYKYVLSKISNVKICR
jgi:hypothetical protein